MRQPLFIFSSCCVLSLLLGLPAYAQLDHFNVYNVSGGPDGPVVQIADQFGSMITDLGPANHFLVPADKNGEGITDFFSHLASYDILDPVLAPPAVISINQFGTQTLSLGESSTLLVPTEKLIAPGPVNLDHYLCYDATGPSIDIGVSIQDQFQSQTAVVLDPFLFCTPADVNGEGIQNPDDHLTIYHYTPQGQSLGVSLPILNQFFPSATNIDVTEPFALAVPSLALNFILGDMNGDFNVTVADAGLLVEALTNRTAYDLHSFDVDPDINGDTDGSGTFDSGDLAAFNALLTPASAAGVPEPSTLLLTLFALDGVAGRRRRTSA